MSSELQRIHPNFTATITPVIGITKYQLNQEVFSMGLKSKEVVDEE